MHIADTTVKKILKSVKDVDATEIKKLSDAATRQKKSLQDVVLQHGTLSDEQLSRSYAEISEIPFIKLDPKKVDTELLKLVPERISRRYSAVVFGKENGVMQLAMEDPDDLQAIDFIQKQLGAKPAII